MAIIDIGPTPNSFNLETATTENTNYRTVAWTGEYLQVTLMSIPVGESIGLEMHSGTDQFLRLDAGTGKAQMGPSKDTLTFEQDVADGWCVLVPAGTWHNVTNTGEVELKLYSLYSPAEHPDGTIHRTKAEADAAEHDH